MFEMFRKQPPVAQKDLPWDHPEALIATIQAAVQKMTMAELKDAQMLIAHRVVAQPYTKNITRLAVIQAQICILEAKGQGDD